MVPQALVAGPASLAVVAAVLAVPARAAVVRPEIKDLFQTGRTEAQTLLFPDDDL